MPLFNHTNPTLLTSHKVIPTSPRMRNQPRQLPILIKNHPIRARRTTRVRRSTAQDRELIIRRLHREVKVLVVVVDVRVAAAAGVAALLDVVVAGVLGGGDDAAGIAVAAAGVVASASDLGLGGRGGEGGLDEEEGGEGEVLWWCWLVGDCGWRERSGPYLCELHFGLGIVNWGERVVICSCSRGY